MPQHGAIITNKRWDENQGLYLATVQCSSCHHFRDVAFGGWTAVKCGNCPEYLYRTQYRQTWKEEAIKAFMDKECRCDGCVSFVETYCGINAEDIYEEEHDYSAALDLAEFYAW